MSISSVTTNYKWTIQKQIIYSLVGSELMPHHLERVQEVLKHCISLPYLQKFIKKHDIGLGYIPRVLGDRCTFQKLIKTSTQCQIFGGK